MCFEGALNIDQALLVMTDLAQRSPHVDQRPNKRRLIFQGFGIGIRCRPIVIGMDAPLAFHHVDVVRNHRRLDHIQIIVAGIEKLGQIDRPVGSRAIRHQNGRRIIAMLIDMSEKSLSVWSARLA